MRSRRRVLSVVGTRPNYMKIAPIASLLAQHDGFDHVLVHTGQHYDDSMSQIFFEQLVTLHRPALTDGPLLARAIAELRHIARELPVVSNGIRVRPSTCQ